MAIDEDGGVAVLARLEGQNTAQNKQVLTY